MKMTVVKFDSSGSTYVINRKERVVMFLDGNMIYSTGMSLEDIESALRLCIASVIGYAKITIEM